MELLRVSGKEVVANTIPNELLMALTHHDPPRSLLISILNRRMEGRLVNSTGAFILSAQKPP